MTQYKPRRAMAQSLISQRNARIKIRSGSKDQARAAIKKMRLTAGLPWTEEIRIVGVLNDRAERRIRDELSEAWGADKIRVFFKSPGGLLSVGSKIAEDLEELAPFSRIECHAQECASAAILPFLAGQYRTCAPDARFVIHGGSAQHDSIRRMTSQELRLLARDIEASDDADLSLLQRKLRFSPDQIKAYKNGADVVFDALQALAVGLVGSIDPIPNFGQLSVPTHRHMPKEAKDARDRANERYQTMRKAEQAYKDANERRRHG